MNREYRNDFAKRVNAARSSRTLMITHEKFDEFEREIVAKRKAGEISAFDFVNCGCVIGDAVNIARAE